MFGCLGEVVPPGLSRLKVLLPWGLAPIRLPLIAGGHQRKHPQPSRLKVSGTSSGLLVLRALDSMTQYLPRWKNVFSIIETLSWLRMKLETIPGWELSRRWAFKTPEPNVTCFHSNVGLKVTCHLNTYLHLTLTTFIIPGRPWSKRFLNSILELNLPPVHGFSE